MSEEERAKTVEDYLTPEEVEEFRKIPYLYCHYNCSISVSSRFSYWKRCYGIFPNCNCLSCCSDSRRIASGYYFIVSYRCETDDWQECFGALWPLCTRDFL